MIFEGLTTTCAKSASATGTGTAPARTGASARSLPAACAAASSAPTSVASSGMSASPSSRAAVVPAPVRIVASRMVPTLVRAGRGPGPPPRSADLSGLGRHLTFIYDRGEPMSEQPDPPRPSKIVAVHSSYRSRALERGTLPPWPSYFLKPPSTLAGDGDPVLRPPGCELLAFEGEVALDHRDPGHAGSARAAPGSTSRWVTAANDFGVYDLRYADKGSNVRSKGIDGYTPLGPGLLDARAVDLASIRVSAPGSTGSWPRTPTRPQDLLFGFADIVADCPRLTTLEPGDVILTGTPTGSTVVKPGDLVEVEVTALLDGARQLHGPAAQPHRRGRVPARPAGRAAQGRRRAACSAPTGRGEPARAFGGRRHRRRRGGLHRHPRVAAQEARLRLPHPGPAALHPARHGRWPASRAPSATCRSGRTCSGSTAADSTPRSRRSSRSVRARSSSSRHAAT